MNELSSPEKSQQERSEAISLDPAAIDTIVARIEAAGLSEASVAALRGDYPGVHFTYAFDDDMNGMEPPRNCRGFNVYYVDSSDHCSKITLSLERASGLVLAEVIDD